ncbi:GntR family transcriptional regulator [Devosia ginsengisoli]|uniref:GntR family transcriptional regulator n=1 Tax=Devosia ginsengisoli TaxID=400770 RepID=A0A5B8LV20_9HYPH|nr:GntR family transcriptional regulator [Devosia ginsengisoli]QDZ11906.1 GntR family transcriptional regulator [Devosia ginsengisoli]
MSKSPQTPRRPAALIRSRSLVDLAHEEIHKRITNGEIAQGERLIIDALAQEFGTSLIPVREALARLHAERLVSFEANKGYRVAAPPDALELRHLFSARLILEVGALETAIPLVDSDLIVELREINARMGRGTYGTTFESYVDFVKLNAVFHEKVVGLSGNPFIIEAYRTLAYHQRIMQVLHGRGVPDITKLVAEHETIIDALQAGSHAVARQAIRQHILNGSERLSPSSEAGSP